MDLRKDDRWDEFHRLIKCARKLKEVIGVSNKVENPETEIAVLSGRTDALLCRYLRAAVELSKSADPELFIEASLKAPDRTREYRWMRVYCDRVEVKKGDKVYVEHEEEVVEYAITSERPRDSILFMGKNYVRGSDGHPEMDIGWHPVEYNL